MTKNFQEQKKYYDDRWMAEDHRVNQKSMARGLAILKLLNALDFENANILDFGCGNGWFSNVLSHFGKVTGFDLSEKAIEMAQKKYPYVKFRSGNALKKMEINDLFDVVVSQEVIEHIEDQDQYVNQIKKFLKKNGYLILSTPNKYVQKHRTEKELNDWGLQPIENWLTKNELKNLLKPDFKVIHCSSLITGLGSLGVFKIINSQLLKKVLTKIRLIGVYNRILCRLGYGLNLIILAKRIR